MTSPAGRTPMSAWPSPISWRPRARVFPWKTSPSPRAVGGAAPRAFSYAAGPGHGHFFNRDSAEGEGGAVPSATWYQNRWSIIFAGSGYITQALPQAGAALRISLDGRGKPCFQKEEVLRRRAELEGATAPLKRLYRRRQIIFYSVFFAVGIIIMVLTARFTYYRQVAVTQADRVDESRLMVLFLGTDDIVEAAPERIRSCSIHRYRIW